jgi:CBS domain-containing protein
MIPSSNAWARDRGILTERDIVRSMIQKVDDEMTTMDIAADEWQFHHNERTSRERYELESVLKPRTRETG